VLADGRAGSFRRPATSPPLERQFAIVDDAVVDHRSFFTDFSTSPPLSMFPVVPVPDQAAHLVEALGTKPKFWFRGEKSVDYLFKEVRSGGGEDWSEKVASELCGLLGLPHATYELATWQGKRGVITPTFVPRDGQLVLGNELLGRIVPGYPAKRYFRVRQHTLRVVMKIIGHRLVKRPVGFCSFASVESGSDVFVGYLMLDAWIANQDRHHENWGLVVTPTKAVHLAPSYDHASSLGRNETDENRKDRLTTRDAGCSMERYVERAASAFYASPSSRKPLSTLRAFKMGAELRPSAAKSWLKRLEGVSLRKTRSLLESVPPDRISAVAVDFAQKILELNSQRLLALREA
jgi:hypothetical protein